MTARRSTMMLVLLASSACFTAPNRATLTVTSAAYIGRVEAAGIRPFVNVGIQIETFGRSPISVTVRGALWGSKTVTVTPSEDVTTVGVTLYGAIGQVVQFPDTITVTATGAAPVQHVTGPD